MEAEKHCHLDDFMGVDATGKLSLVEISGVGPVYNATMAISANIAISKITATVTILRVYK